MRGMIRLLRRGLGWFGTIPTTTLEGRVFLTATGIFAIIALAGGRNGPLLVLAALVAIVATSLVASGRNLHRLTVERRIPSRVVVGEEFSVRLRITNPRRFTPALAVRVRDALHPAAVGSGSLVVPIIPPRSTVDVSFPARIRRRGAYRITNAMLITSYPFGLMERRALRKHPSEILVTPREERSEVDIDGSSRSRLRQDALGGSRRAGTEEFAGLREYRPGDNPRWMAWKASARQGRLMVRELDRPRRRRVVVLLDTDATSLATWARRPALERGISLAAGLATRLRAMGRRAIFAAFEPRPLVISAISRRSGRRALLQSLSVLRAAPGRSPVELLGYLEARHVRGSTVVLITARSGADWTDLDGRVRRLGGRLRLLDATPARKSARVRRARGE